MGFRTVIALNNDQAHEWQKDPQLGQQIYEAMHWKDFGRLGTRDRPNPLRYGYVIECVHADQESLAVLENYNGRIIGTSSWYSDKTADQTSIDLLKAAADKLGYRLTKKAVRK